MYREIPYNYTSADDKKVVETLFNKQVWQKLEALRQRRRTGRSARLLLRLIGDIFIFYRNPFLQYELLYNRKRHKQFFRTAANDLRILRRNSSGDREVINVLNACQEKLEHFKQQLATILIRRRQLKKKLLKNTGSKISFRPFDLTAHMTDATDWRLTIPLAVVFPAGRSDVRKTVAILRELKLGIIARGAGTGLTGGAVPLAENTVIINTEKMNRIQGIETVELHFESENRQTASVLRLQAGVVTEDAMSYAAARGYLFATDPTSSWASTIGGNIAENAGGKSAVKWGTAIDNIFSFCMITPSGRDITVQRARHPLRKINYEDQLAFYVFDNESGEQLAEIKLSGADIRRKGLGKDVTNKWLKGVPGLQKEGTDGLIYEAAFILYKPYAFCKTICLEFFGTDMTEAATVIGQLCRHYTAGKAALTAMEHFDEQYIDAISYRAKSSCDNKLQAVLLIDISSDDKNSLRRAEQQLGAMLADHKFTFMHAALDQQEADKFWEDRKKLGAIARRTNAFKLNEDIVLPLASLPVFAGFAAGNNQKELYKNQCAYLSALAERLNLIKKRENEDQPYLQKRIDFVFKNLNRVQEILRPETAGRFEGRSIIEDFNKRTLEQLKSYPAVCQEIKDLYMHIYSRRIVIATHMHAGDGNIHVNIPVFSNDLEMMQAAEETADLVMQKTMELGGVVSGEHGIGITKIKYLDPEQLAVLNKYRADMDPDGLWNPVKLRSAAVLNSVFTPSFNLLEIEADILKHGKLGALAEEISPCVRCGKCKPDCCVFYPARDLFFHPRNKNLAIGVIIEALLYQTQRYHETDFTLLQHMEEIADHCTVCHKCLAPCPVEIDTGNVSILEREILSDFKYKHTAPVTFLSLKYLQSVSRLFNNIFHFFILRLAPVLQQTAFLFYKYIRKANPWSRHYLFALLDAPMPVSDAGSLADTLPSCSRHQSLVLNGSNTPIKTVFYFPGCGSERLLADISRAAVYLLLKNKIRVILPPPFICCGFPFKVNADKEYTRIALRNNIIFNQIRDMFSYLDFDACLVTCGTCKEALQESGCEEIFNAPLKDAAAYLAAEQISFLTAGNFLYHKPCHDSLADKGPAVMRQLGIDNLTSTPHCCSEAGTLAFSRPDIATALRDKKGRALKQVQTGAKQEIITNCPSCVQGLRKQPQLKAEHLTVKLAELEAGKNWRKKLSKLLKNYEKVTF
ncbi:MAG TPA: DUF3683 domain-containing protein [Spirochaetota bacterium]|nr:DUF3683 domain-containing protein [Spirochaetota bacterium]